MNGSIRWVGFLALALGLTVPAFSKAIAQTAPQDVPVGTYLDFVVETIDARQKRMVDRFDTTAMLNDINSRDGGNKLAQGDLRTRCYFDFGDISHFRQLVSSGLSGVVIDPGYIEGVGANAAALYQNVNRFSIAFSSQEGRYNGFIILKEFVASQEAKLIQSLFGTYIHEAIHSAAYGAGRTDLDIDEDAETPVVAGAPEYLGYYFFIEQAALAEAEHKALAQMHNAFVALRAVFAGNDLDEDKALIEGAVKDFAVRTASAAEDYLREAKAIFKETEGSFKASDGHTIILDRQKARELIGLWSGRADWDKLIADAEQRVSVLQRFRDAPSIEKGLPAYFEPLFDFFFKKNCLDE